MASGQQNALLVDALPYIDTEYDETARQAALALIEDECKRFKPTKDYLAHLPAPSGAGFETEALRNEMERIQQRQPMEMLNMKRYELPGPSHGRMTDVNAWQEAVNNSKAQLEHQAARLANLETMEEFGPEAWMAYNSTLERVMKKAQHELIALRQEVQEIHVDRKRQQVAAGEKLKALESSWVSLVSKNYEIENALIDLESEVEPLRKKYKPSDS